jgi:hypothetical protein
MLEPAQKKIIPYGVLEPVQKKNTKAQELSSVIRQALRETTMPSVEVLAQDFLDVLAVDAGLKPTAVIGFGYPMNNALDRIITLAPMLGMATSMSHPWQASCDSEDLPSWYVETLARLYASTPIHIVSAIPASLNALMTDGSPLSPEQESHSLAYPSCCVNEYHRRRHAYHLLTLDMLARQVNGDELRMRRLVQSGVAMAPKDETETTALLWATRTNFAPCTSIAMCGACAADSDSPARRISAQFRRLADRAGLLPFLSPI